MFNKCSFIGRVGQAPEIRTTQAGKEVANLSLGVSEKWKDADGQRQERTEWVRISVFNEGLVKVIKNYITKGQLIYIEGAMKTRKWEKNGQDQYTTEIVLSGFNGVLVMLSKSDNEKPAEAVLDDPNQAIPF